MGSRTFFCFIFSWIFPFSVCGKDEWQRSCPFRDVGSVSNLSLIINESFDSYVNMLFIWNRCLVYFRILILINWILRSLIIWKYISIIYDLINNAAFELISIENLICFVNSENNQYQRVFFEYQNFLLYLTSFTLQLALYKQYITIVNMMMTTTIMSVHKMHKCTSHA